jgi:hypothetical protein
MHCCFDCRLIIEYDAFMLLRHSLSNSALSSLKDIYHNWTVTSDEKLTSLNLPNLSSKHGRWGLLACVLQQ